MGAMSDLHLLAGEVRDELKSGAGSVDEAVDAVARHATYDPDDIEWAYRERFE